MRAVAELDATADKCLFFWDEAMTRRACGHVDGDPECLATRLDANDDEAHRQAQLFFTGEAVPCPVCGVYAVCDCLDGEP